KRLLRFSTSNPAVPAELNPGRRNALVRSGSILLGAVIGVRALTAQTAELEGVARGFPELRDSHGNKLARGEFIQEIQNERLHVKIRYDFSSGHYAEESAVFRQRPQLVQESWSFREERDGKLFRQFQVQFASGTAEAKELENGKLKEWSEKLKVQPGQAF